MLLLCVFQRMKSGTVENAIEKKEKGCFEEVPYHTTLATAATRKAKRRMKRKKKERLLERI